MAKQVKSKKSKKTESMRDKAAKASNAGAPKHRVRKAATVAGKPVKKAVSVGKSEFYLIKPREKGFAGFLTKPRRWIPKYFRESWQELKKVTWPGRVTTWKLVFAVFAFAIVFGVAIALVDYVLELVFKRIIL